MTAYDTRNLLAPSQAWLLTVVPRPQTLLDADEAC
jgi:hypothetical protein